MHRANIQVPSTSQAGGCANVVQASPELVARRLSDDMISRKLNRTVAVLQYVAETVKGAREEDDRSRKPEEQGQY
jgi:hypothetical protein